MKKRTKTAWTTDDGRRLLEEHTGYTIYVTQSPISLAELGDLAIGAMDCLLAMDRDQAVAAFDAIATLYAEHGVVEETVSG